MPPRASRTTRSGTTRASIRSRSSAPPTDSLRGIGRRGASTITQQLVRARLLPDSVLAGSSVDRKIKEIIQSIRLTQALPPATRASARSCSYYLNQNFYGNQSYGVAAAAQELLRGHGPQQADARPGGDPGRHPPVAHATTTSSRTPTSRRTPTGNPILVVPPDTRDRPAPQPGARGDAALPRPHRSPASTARSRTRRSTAAEKEPVILAPQNNAQLARRRTSCGRSAQELGQQPLPAGPRRTAPRSTRGGYTVTTTLDWNMQKTAEKWVQAAVLGAEQQEHRRLSSRARACRTSTWIENLRGKNIHNGALVAIDYRTGQILAYVGSADYYSPTKSKQFQPQFDVLADGWRQPGSAMKPINYITGFEDRTITPGHDVHGRRDGLRRRLRPDRRRQPRARPAADAPGAPCSR